MIIRKIICVFKGHKPVRMVYVALGATPAGEPTISQFKKWTGKESEVIGTAATNSFFEGERCGKRLEEDQNEMSRL